MAHLGVHDGDYQQQNAAHSPANPRGAEPVATTLLSTIAIVTSVLGTGGAIWFALRKDRLDVRTAREAELTAARQAGYADALKDARLASVEARLNELNRGDQP